MTITRRLMKPGAFSVKLRPDTPWDVYGDTINRFDQIVVTANRLLPIEAFSNANILASSIFTGVITKEVTSDQLEGHGLDWYLGTPDGYGVGTGSSSSTQGLITTPISQTAATLSAWITALCPPALAVGTVNNSGLSTLTNTYQGLTRREAATSVCTMLGAEYRVNNTGTIDAATPANLFGATPSAIITRNKDARDAGLYGIESTGISLTIDVDDYISSAIVVTKGTGVAATATRVDGTAGFRDFAGNPMYVERYIDAPDGLAANASLIAAAALAKFNAERKDLRLSSNTYSVTRFVEPGDYVWVWDQELGLVDSSNQVQFRGGVVQPLLLRVMGLTFPIEEGMGVYVRHATGAGTYTYTDITDSVQFETSATVWEVGAPRRIYAGGNPAIGTTAVLGDNPAIASRLAGGERIAYTPTMKAGGIAISLGNGSMSGWASADDTHAKVEIQHVLGTTTSYGAGGALSFTLPAWLPPASSALGFPVGRVEIVDGSTPYFRDVIISGAGELEMWADGVQVTNTVPFSMGSADYFRLSVRYPIV